MPEGGVTISRRQLEPVFGEDFEALRQFELLMEQINEWLNVGIPGANVTLETANFDNLLSSSDDTVQKAMDTLDNVVAFDILTDATGFNGILSPLDTSVQLALETIDNIDTDNVPEGGTNLYYTDERVDDRVATLIINTTTITWVYNDVAGTLEASVTDSVFEELKRYSLLVG